MLSQNYSSVLVGMCFAYSIVDVLGWKADNCLMPIQGWLLISYLSVGIFVGTQKLGMQHTRSEKNFLFSFRQKSQVAQLVVIFTWSVLLPFFTVWTILGTHWLRETRNASAQCVSEGGHPELIFFWQLLSFVWILIHFVYFGIATIVEYRLRRDERNMRLIESPESVERWGQLQPQSELIERSTIYNSHRGLHPSKILALPCGEFKEAQNDRDVEADGQLACPICLSDFAEGEHIRTLPGCGHSFHKGCIDLWLFRRADCPLCKADVS